MSCALNDANLVNRKSSAIYSLNFFLPKVVSPQQRLKANVKSGQCVIVWRMSMAIRYRHRGAFDVFANNFFCFRAYKPKYVIGTDTNRYFFAKPGRFIKKSSAFLMAAKTYSGIPVYHCIFF